MKLIKEYCKVFLKQWKSILLIVLSLVIYNAIFWIFFKNTPTCMVKIMFGIPCPTCGITRALFSLIRLDLKAAFYWHPLFFLVPIICFVIIFRERPFWSKVFHSKVFWFTILFLFILVYILRLIFVYPNEPMSPYSGIIQKIFKK